MLMYHTPHAFASDLLLLCYTLYLIDFCSVAPHQKLCGCSIAVLWLFYVCSVDDLWLYLLMLYSCSVDALWL